jgi:hypothetical protein
MGGRPEKWVVYSIFQDVLNIMLSVTHIYKSTKHTQAQANNAFKSKRNIKNGE